MTLSVVSKQVLDLALMADGPVAGAKFYIQFGLCWRDACYIMLSFRTPYGSEQDDDLALYKLTADGPAQRVTGPDGPGDLLTYHSIVPLPEGLVFVPLQVPEGVQTTLQYCAFDGHHMADPVALYIQNDPAAAGFRELTQESAQILYPTSEGMPIAAVPHARGGGDAGLAFLQIDTEAQMARWVTWPTTPQAKHHVTVLNADDYPKYSGYNEFEIEAQAVAMRGNTVQIMSRGGMGRSTKYGTPGTHLAELGVDGRTTRTLHYDDFSTGPLAQKNQARQGQFVDHGRRFVMRSVYKATDPWKGAECLIDMETATPQVLTPPRGCKDMAMLDACGNTGWFWRAEKDGSATVWQMQISADG